MHGNPRPDCWHQRHLIGLARAVITTGTRLCYPADMPRSSQRWLSMNQNQRDAIRNTYTIYRSTQHRMLFDNARARLRRAAATTLQCGPHCDNARTAVAAPRRIDEVIRTAIQTARQDEPTTRFVTRMRTRAARTDQARRIQRTRRHTTLPQCPYWWGGDRT